MTGTSVSIGTDRFSAYDVLALGVARDVTILPTTATVQSLPNGGPVLSDPDLARMARHQRGGRPLGGPPPDAPDSCPHLDEAVIWGGIAAKQAHIMASEFCARLLPALEHRPQDRVAFVLPKGQSVAELRDGFWQIMAWFGLPPERILLVEEPLTVAELWIASPAEQAVTLGPSYHYLELLARNTTNRGLAPISMPVAYVPGASLDTEGGTPVLGETYLAECLDALDVTIIDPDTASLVETLEGYAGAETLVFGEGPPVRVRQLLGFYEQDIVVLAREPGERLAIDNLLPRARRLTYGDVTRGMITLIRSNGQPDRSLGLSVYDPEAVLSLFEGLGVPLRDAWDQANFEAVCGEELQFWLKRQFNQVRQRNNAFDWDKSIAQVRSDLGRFGITYARAEAQFWLKRRQGNA